jgi:hypothetical protein
MKFHRYVTGIALAVGLGCTTAYADSVQFEIVDGVNAVTCRLSEGMDPGFLKTMDPPNPRRVTGSLCCSPPEVV